MLGVVQNAFALIAPVDLLFDGTRSTASGAALALVQNHVAHVFQDLQVPWPVFVVAGPVALLLGFIEGAFGSLVECHVTSRLTHAHVQDLKRRSILGGDVGANIQRYICIIGAVQWNKQSVDHPRFSLSHRRYGTND